MKQAVQKCCGVSVLGRYSELTCTWPW